MSSPPATIVAIKPTWSSAGDGSRRDGDLHRGDEQHGPRLSRKGID